MCGIAGSFLDSQFSVHRATERLRHRGPDGLAVQEWEGVTHGHCRLALLDLSSASAQPFMCRKGCLSFVGEIWNYRELRAELIALGQVFRTTGDTEVLAVALHVWGISALNRLDGMFAFAWSSPDLRILARDAYGKIPLYVATRGAGVCWASERKAFSGEIFESVHALPPGCVMDMHSNVVSPWYQFPNWETKALDVSQFNGRNILEHAVAKRLNADAPVCVLISGGLDSAGVLCAARATRPDVVAYTAFSDEKSPDLAAARRLCTEIGVELREVCVPFPTSEDLRAAVWAIEIPMKAQVEIAVLCLPLAKRIAADGFKACLSGATAEEILEKELSLGGVQRPISPHIIPVTAQRFFQFGEFVGWIYEKEEQGLQPNHNFT